MRPYVIRRGDHVTAIAHRVGSRADEIWQHPRNEALRGRRADRDVLAPGDVLFVPEPRRERHPLTPQAANRMVARVPRVNLAITFRDAAGEALANEPFVVHGGPTPPPRGTTDGAGVARFSVPVHTREVHLVLEQRGASFVVAVGDLDPADERSGARQRLEQLGFPCGAHGAGPCDEATLRRAVVAFQRSRDLPPTGELDARTSEALREAHGS
jgi:hypothetical protein